MKKELLRGLLFLIVKSRSAYLSRFFFYIIAKFHPYIEPLGPLRANLLISLLGNDCQKIILSGTGSLMVFLPVIVYKIPLSKHTSISLHKEYEKYSEIKNSKLFDFVNYKLKKRELSKVGYYEMSRLDYFEENNGVPIDEILDSLQSVVTGEGGLLSLKQHSIGLEVFQKYATVEQIKELKVISDSLMSKSAPLCAMHGDLTPSNILRVKSFSVLIDLDRFSFVGFSHIDRLHYLIESEAKLNKENSYSQMLLSKDKILGAHTFYEVMSYLFYRVGAETRDAVVLKDEYYFRIIDVFLQFNTK